MGEATGNIVDALERALEDARAGRLVAFGFAGLGRDERVVCFTFDDDDLEQRSSLLNVIGELAVEVINPRPRAIVEVIP